MALKTDGVFELTGQVDPYFTRRGGGGLRGYVHFKKMYFMKPRVGEYYCECNL